MREVESTGSTPLILAARENEPNVMGLFLQYGASPNAKNDNGLILLIEAVDRESSELRLAMVNTLLSPPTINMNLHNNQGRKVLLYLIRGHGDASLD